MRNLTEVRPEMYGGEIAMREIATAVRAVNRLAKHFARNRSASQQFYIIKNILIDITLTMAANDVRLSWQRLATGTFSVLISLGDYYTVHSFFSRLSPASRCRIVNEIGPEPGSGNLTAEK